MNLIRQTTFLLSSLLCCVSLQAQPRHTAQADAPPGSLDTDTCIEVEVNGEKAPSFGCLTLRLKPTPDAQAQDRTSPVTGSESILQRPGNQLGVFNRAATGHRMGNAFGNSVTPQRPVR